MPDNIFTLYSTHFFSQKLTRHSFFVIKIVLTFQKKVFVGNPLEEDAVSSSKYIEEVTKRLIFLKKLDGYPVIRDIVQVMVKRF